ncbi:MAG: ABC transporter substrate-binding protein [Deltaproteobacteria bacterium]|nr:ABC transporter substrate-binding protein [Deltaproteobacteria bacterium]
MMVLFGRSDTGSFVRRARRADLAALAAVMMLAFIGVAMAPAVAQTGGDALKQLVAAAQKEGELNVFGSGDWNSPKLMAALEKGLNKTYGINVRLKTTPGPSASKLMPRIIDEAKTGRPASTDVFFAPSRQTIPSDQAGALLRVDWKKLMPGLKDEEVGINGAAVVIGASIHIIGYNTNLVKAKDLPKSYKDFTDPKYKGKIGTTVFAVGWVEAAIHLGEEEATRIVDAMVANDTIIGTTRTGVQNRVATGEFPIFAFDTKPVAYSRLKAKGGPVDYATMDDFMSGTASEVSVPKTSANPNLAKLLSVYMLTKQGQDTIWKVIGRDSPFRAGSQLNKLVESKRAAGAKIYFGTDQNVVKNAYFYRKVSRKLAKKLRGN